MPPTLDSETTWMWCVGGIFLLALAGWTLAGRWFSGRVDRALAAVAAAALVVALWSDALALGGIAGSNVGEMLISAPGAAAWSAAAAAFAVAFRMVGRRRSPSPSPVNPNLPPMPVGDRCVGAAVVALAGWAAWSRLLRGLAFPVEPISDGPIYHLYFAVRWFRERAVGEVATPFGELAASYFPANGSAWFCWLTTTLGGVELAKVGQWPFLIVAAFAVYGLCVRLSGDRLSSTVAAGMWAGTLATLGFAAVPNVDLLYTAFAVIGFHFLVRAAEEGTGETTSALAMAWLAFGLAIGTKTVALPLALPWAALATVGLLLRSTTRGRFRLATVSLGACVLGAGPWHWLNILRTGNPLFPLRVELFGVTLLDGCYDSTAMRNSTYSVPPADWHVFVDRLTTMLDLRICWFWALSIGLGMVGAAAQKIRRRGSASGHWGWCGFFSVAAAGQIATYWFLIPYNTQERFLLPAFALGIVPLSKILAGRRRLCAATAALIGWHLFTPGLATRWRDGATVRLPPLAALPTLDGPWSDAALALTLPAACIASGWMVFGRRWQLATAVVLPALAVGALAARADRMFERDPALRFYPTGDFASRLLPAWRVLESASGPGGASVAYAGTNLPYYLFGSRLKNRVQYIDVGGEIQPWSLHAQWRKLRERQARPAADSPSPQWHRGDAADYERWRALLEREKIELLFIARENYHGRTDAPAVADFPLEYAFAVNHPREFARLGPPAAEGGGEPWAVVFRVRRKSSEPD